MQLLDADGKTLLALVAKPPHFLWAAADADGARFAVLDSPDAGTSDAILTLYDSGGTKLLTRTGVVDRLRIVGFVGERVFLRSSEQYGGTHAWNLTDNTVTSYADWAVVAVNGPSGRAALVAPGDYGEPRCTLVADVRGPTPEPISTTCGAFAAQELSPDGRYLLGTELEPDDPWFQPPSRVIDVTTGRPVLVLGDRAPMRVRSAFLSDGSIGFVLMQSAGKGWTNGLVRCSLDGECTRMLADVAAPYAE